MEVNSKLETDFSKNEKKAHFEEKMEATLPLVTASLPLPHIVRAIDVGLNEFTRTINGAINV